MEMCNPRELRLYHQELVDAKADVIRSSAKIVKTALANLPELPVRVARAMEIIVNHAEKAVGGEDFKASAIQRQQIIDLLWESLPTEPRDQSKRQTAWGPKSQAGLVECIETIVNDKRGK